MNKNRKCKVNNKNKSNKSNSKNENEVINHCTKCMTGVLFLHSSCLLFLNRCPTTRKKGRIFYSHERTPLVRNRPERNKSTSTNPPSTPSILSLSRSTCKMDGHLTQSSRQTDRNAFQNGSLGFISCLHEAWSAPESST